jgi:hypothetical protein
LYYCPKLAGILLNSKAVLQIGCVREKYDHQLFQERQGERMNKKIVIIPFVLLLFLNAFWQAGHTAPVHDDKQVVIFILDSITYADLLGAHTPVLDKLAAQGALGLMNTATASGSAKTAAYLTIGAGARTSASDAVEPALEAKELWEGEKAALVYQRRVGKEPEGSIMNLGIAEIISSNRELPATAVPGALGQLLSEAGLTRSLLGNCDLSGVPRRPAAGIIMDTMGVVDRGIIGEDILRKNPSAPYGRETDIGSLLQAFQEVAGSNVIVIDWGDTARVDNYNRFLLPDLGAAARTRAIERADTFLGELLSRLDLEKTLFFLIIPSPSAGGYREGDRLTPVLLAGNGITPGLLTSPTTRRTGLIANIDIAPTILTYFQLPVPHYMTGRPISVMPADYPQDYLTAMERVFLGNYKYRPFLIKAYIVFILLVLAGTLLVIYKAIRWQYLLAALLVSVAAVPLVFLILPLFALEKLESILLMTVIGTAVLVKLVNRFYYPPRPFLLLALATAGLLLLDLLLGQSLVFKSILGYCPISGARYYGIGNEYMGLLLGAGIIGLTGLAEEFRYQGKPLNPFVLTVPGFFLIFVFISSPQLGANLGGTIAAMVGFGTTIIRLQERKIPLGNYFLFACAGGFFLLALGVADYLGAQDAASHLGRTAGIVIAGGLKELFTIMHRKASMNLKLLRYSWWSLVLMATLLIFIIISLRPPRLLKDIKRKFPTLWAGFAGGGAGALAAFFANDSGVVAAATALLFPLTTLLFLLVHPNQKESEGLDKMR